MVPAKSQVLERVRLGLYGETPVATAKRDAFWHRPGLQHAFMFEAKIEVQAAGVVTLNHKARSGTPRCGRARCGLRRTGEVAACSVVVERITHRAEYPSPAPRARSWPLPGPKRGVRWTCGMSVHKAALSDRSEVLVAGRTA